ncbi:MAG: DUF202 domain-containing protein [Sandaracinaceae bacterium]|jgi:putative membrane protein|nr:DUF202 domain-containing protein [Sandaracinaceae bacterium]MBP7680878.1 DUF202 domain-containing protein [Deltaproteobacteria bacterium]MBK6810532.1 DUF202 domain-containing protein [Sandaracinaceae bacterium]MBK7154649.1 DUF202 domain-containing protein [Sandaracinaceae bacterium]MBK7775455.1 DUF202 domain-containing protein [Sandaracinaceae bacterium]
MRADYLAVSVTDALAAERTVLAAERTFLAYLRSAFALFVAGVTGAQLLEAQWLLAVAYALAIIAPLVLLVGVQRLRASRRVVAELLARMANERRRSGA